MSDTAPPIPQGYSPAPGPPQKGWFGRNWWWFLGLLIGGPLLCCCGGSGIFYFLFKDKVLKVTQTYQQPMKLVQSNDRAIELIGEPMVGGDPTHTERHANGKDYLILTFTVTGPSGSGVITAESEVDIAETLIKAELVIDGTGEVIDLLSNSDNSANPEEDLDGGVSGTPAPSDETNGDGQDNE